MQVRDVEEEEEEKEEEVEEEQHQDVVLAELRVAGRGRTQQRIHDR